MTDSTSDYRPQRRASGLVWDWRLMMLAEDSLSVKTAIEHLLPLWADRRKKAQQFVEALRTAGISAEKTKDTV